MTQNMYSYGEVADPWLNAEVDFRRHGMAGFTESIWFSVAVEKCEFQNRTQGTRETMAQQVKVLTKQAGQPEVHPQSPLSGRKEHISESRPPISTRKM